jgi:hypothetical protein
VETVAGWQNQNWAGRIISSQKATSFYRRFGYRGFNMAVEGKEYDKSKIPNEE